MAPTARSTTTPSHAASPNATTTLLLLLAAAAIVVLIALAAVLYVTQEHRRKIAAAKQAEELEQTNFTLERQGNGVTIARIADGDLLDGTRITNTDLRDARPVIQVVISRETTVHGGPETARAVGRRISKMSWRLWSPARRTRRGSTISTSSSYEFTVRTPSQPPPPLPPKPSSFLLTKRSLPSSKAPSSSTSSRSRLSDLQALTVPSVWKRSSFSPTHVTQTASRLRKSATSPMAPVAEHIGAEQPSPVSNAQSTAVSPVAPTERIAPQIWPVSRRHTHARSVSGVEAKPSVSGPLSEAPIRGLRARTASFVL